MKFDHLLSLNGSQIRLHKERRQVSTTTANMTAQEVSLNYPPRWMYCRQVAIYWVGIPTRNLVSEASKTVGL